MHEIWFGKKTNNNKHLLFICGVEILTEDILQYQLNSSNYLSILHADFIMLGLSWDGPEPNPVAARQEGQGFFEANMSRNWLSFTSLSTNIEQHQKVNVSMWMCLNRHVLVLTGTLQLCCFVLIESPIILCVVSWCKMTQISRNTHLWSQRQFLSKSHLCAELVHALTMNALTNWLMLLSCYSSCTLFIHFMTCYIGVSKWCLLVLAVPGYLVGFFYHWFYQRQYRS